MNEQPLMEVREDFMISPTGHSEATLRMWPLKFHFNGWRHPQEKWIYWVDPFIGEGGGGGGRVGATDGVEGSLLLGGGGEKK
ncbi:hypothetical protein MTR_5g009540 [Medicago truncatula]|uniref:Uncharacterized protein n=1 Tax=Medicago truncatula TaxID=3880 RepID=G7KAM8_MEDTR|nr:hypothetical protein MTR_5g009540 [Medicago truncatula]